MCIRDRIIAGWLVGLATTPFEKISQLLSPTTKRALKTAWPLVKPNAEKVQTISAGTKEEIRAVVHDLDKTLERIPALLAFIEKELTIDADKQAAPKGLSGFEDTGLGHLPCNQFVAENLGAQMLGGKGWQSKQGGFVLNEQGAANIYKTPSKGGRIHITLGGFDAAEQAASQIQSTILEQYGALSVDVTLTLLAILGDPRQVHYPLVETVFINTKTILKNKGFERYGKDARLIEQQIEAVVNALAKLRVYFCLLYTSPSPRDRTRSRMPSSA